MAGRYLPHSFSFSKKTILRPVEFSIKFYTFRSGWSIVYIDVLQIKISQNFIHSFH